MIIWERRGMVGELREWGLNDDKIVCKMEK